MQNLTGLEYGRFKIQELLGFGGFAAVYRAEEMSSGGTVALKVLATEYGRDQLIKKMFLREAAFSLSLQHVNLVQSIELGEVYEKPFIVYSYEKAESLSALVRRRDPSETTFYLEAFSGVARGIDYLHDNGVIHRDITPNNILVSAKGCAKLIDFGLAVRTSELASIEATVLAIAAPGYAAPEAIKGSRKQTSAVDIYGFAATIRESVRELPAFSPFRNGIERALESAEVDDPKMRPMRASQLFNAVRLEVEHE
jgi:serine/threonine protein kinase